MSTTPVSLLERLRSPGNQKAWERFVDLYTPMLYAWSRQMGLQESKAADLVQDVLIILIQTMPEFTYNKNKSFRAWLWTVTRRRYLNTIKKDSRQPFATDKTAEWVDESPKDQFVEAEYHKYLVNRATKVMQAEFQPTTWRAFWESEVEGKSAAEVAAELGITPNAVYIAKSRVLSRLRQELAGLDE